MSETPKYLTEEWHREGDTIFATENFYGETRNRWRARVERCDFDFGKQELEAIASLMQAAPKLLAAIQDAVRYLQYLKDSGIDNEGPSELALEAIAEATGGAK